VWGPVLTVHVRRRAGVGAAVGAGFALTVQCGVLGALIAFAPVAWYAAHGPGAEAWGTTALADQQLAGFVMWVPGGILYAGLTLTVAGAWLVSSYRRDAEMSHA